MCITLFYDTTWFLNSRVFSAAPEQEGLLFLHLLFDEYILHNVVEYTMLT